MALRDVLAAEIEGGARTDETTGTDTDTATDSVAGSRVKSPFSMDYDLSHYDVDDQAIDRGLSMLVAVTNLI